MVVLFAETTGTLEVVLECGTLVFEFEATGKAVLLAGLCVLILVLDTRGGTGTGVEDVLLTGLISTVKMWTENRD